MQIEFYQVTAFGDTSVKVMVWNFILGCYYLEHNYKHKISISTKLSYHAETGTQETTKKSGFYDVTSVINVDNLPEQYEQVILGIISDLLITWMTFCHASIWNF